MQHLRGLDNLRVVATERAGLEEPPISRAAQIRDRPTLFSRMHTPDILAHFSRATYRSAYNVCNLRLLSLRGGVHVKRSLEHAADWDQLRTLHILGKSGRGAEHSDPSFLPRNGQQRSP